MAYLLQGKTQPKQKAAQTQSQSNITIAERKANVEAEAKVRNQALANMKRQLRNVLSNLAAISDDEKAYQRQVEKLKAILNGHLPYFESEVSQ